MTFTKDSKDLIIEFKNKINEEINHTNEMIDSIKRHFPNNKKDISNLIEYEHYLLQISDINE